MVSFEWAELQRALEKLAASPAQEERAGSFVEALRTRAQDLTGQEMLELILTGAHFVQHEDPESLRAEYKAISHLH